MEGEQQRPTGEAEEVADGGGPRGKGGRGGRGGGRGGRRPRGSQELSVSASKKPRREIPKDSPILALFQTYATGLDDVVRSVLPHLNYYFNLQKKNIQWIYLFVAHSLCLVILLYLSLYFCFVLFEHHFISLIF